ncbi:hypothetical protein RKE29_18620 [Streptomyces sp. B1866]|uniref:hypothetical protein n=1 Tax=Streptomyces sp. B1866 TaxID=3075431 RepID=UPI0028914BDC|nr:hypothetical protein [Streptomyces sp. B1866]MDT3398634.1 hypothetical protein [Streptomyces sp. B1866]
MPSTEVDLQAVAARLTKEFRDAAPHGFEVTVRARRIEHFELHQRPGGDFVPEPRPERDHLLPTEHALDAQHALDSLESALARLGLVLPGAYVSPTCATCPPGAGARICLGNLDADEARAWAAAIREVTEP